MVMAWALPDCDCSGAMTTTSPKDDATSVSFAMPRAETPSSLVMKIRGLSILVSFLKGKDTNKPSAKANFHLHFAVVRNIFGKAKDSKNGDRSVCGSA